MATNKAALLANLTERVYHKSILLAKQGRKCRKREVKEKEVARKQNHS